MSKQVSKTLQEMLGNLKEGRMTEGQESYSADAVVTQEGNQPPILGKQASTERLNKFRETRALLPQLIKLDAAWERIANAIRSPQLSLKSPARIINQTEWKTMNVEGQSNRCPQVNLRRRIVPFVLLGLILLTMEISVFAQTMEKANPTRVTYNIVKVDGVDVFYREAGPKDAPVLLLLHGFPTSSHMFRNLIPQLADKYRVIAPDYPGFGQSAMPERSKFSYTFDNYAQVVDKLIRHLGVNRYALYVMDYGAPVGFRLASKNPERVTALIVQNGNAYNEGLEQFWDPIKAYWRTGGSSEREAIRWLTSIKATKWQYTNGVKDTSLVSPDTWTMDQTLLDRPGNSEIQLDLFYDYRTNIPLYPQWQAYFREHKPATLVVWGKNDAIFVAAGAAPYKRDTSNAEIHLLDTGHFALETHGSDIARLILEFLGRNLKSDGQD
jgi:pimeloyl-ACP methyl ester carboxylesterase